ncbi:MAG: hypothetical protein INR65_20375, partial [Gluconacetobacter diazotrophicus]|nr:hypothetical protein [Gluconacetobacter diazotrophicus]
MPNFRPVRLGALGNGTGVRVEAVPAGRVVDAPPLRIGARMLDALGMDDPWHSHGDGELPPYGSTVAELAGAGVLSGGGIVFLPGGEVVADTLDH